VFTLSLFLLYECNNPILFHSKTAPSWRCIVAGSRSQWPCCLRRGSTVARLLGLRVRIPLGAWMSVSCECVVLSGRGLCEGLITRTEKFYRVRCVWVWWRSPDTEALAHLRLSRRGRKHVTDNKKTHLGLNVTWPIVLFSFNQISISPTYFHTYQISGKFI